jgi:hypothetical protein
MIADVFSDTVEVLLSVLYSVLETQVQLLLAQQWRVPSLENQAGHRVEIPAVAWPVEQFLRAC